MRRIAVGMLGLLALAGCGEPSQEEKAQKTLSQLRAEISTARSELAEVRQQITDEQAKLDKLTGQVGKAEAEAKKNTIPGEGTFVVGTDINPGVYRAEASEGCYWERMSSLSGGGTDSIIENENADGPVVVEILASDKGFKTHRCAEFHRAKP